VRIKAAENNTIPERKDFDENIELAVEVDSVLPVAVFFFLLLFEFFEP